MIGYSRTRVTRKGTERISFQVRAWEIAAVLFAASIAGQVQAAESGNVPLLGLAGIPYALKHPQGWLSVLL